jgi:hypothetical protein
MKEKLSTQIEKDKALINALGVDSISHHIVKTSKGDLALLLRKNENNYVVTLDTVPLTQDQMTFVMPAIEHLL